MIKALAGRIVGFEGPEGLNRFSSEALSDADANVRLLEDGWASQSLARGERWMHWLCEVEEIAMFPFKP